MGYRFKPAGGEGGEGMLVCTNTADMHPLDEAALAAWRDANNPGDCEVHPINHTCTLEQYRQYGGMPVARLVMSNGGSAKNATRIVDPNAQISTGSAGVPRARQIG
jgi:hypothetical protein